MRTNRGILKKGEAIIVADVSKGFWENTRQRFPFTPQEAMGVYREKVLFELGIWKPEGNSKSMKKHKSILSRDYGMEYH